MHVHDTEITPRPQLKIRKSFSKLNGYSRYSGLGQLTRPVENQPGRWYVKFKGVGETFLSVGRNGVFELAYVDMGLSSMAKSKKTKLQELGEPEHVDDDTSVIVV